MRTPLLGVLLVGAALVTTAGCKRKPKDDGTTPADGYTGNLFAEGFSEQGNAGTLRTAKPASDLLDGCVGFIDEAPTFEFRVVGELPMRVAVAADLDSVMVVQGPNGVTCKDDDVDMNAALGQVWAPGDYKIWVGSYDAQKDEPFFYELSFLHFDPNAAPADPFVGLNKDAPRADGPTAAVTSNVVTSGASQLSTDEANTTLGTHFIAPRAAATPHTLHLSTEGFSPLDALHEGFIGSANLTTPQAIVKFTGGGPLNVTFQSETDADTTLLIHGPEHQLWFADGGLGDTMNPAIHIEDAAEGTYFIHVGRVLDAVEHIQGTLTLY